MAILTNHPPDIVGIKVAEAGAAGDLVVDVEAVAPLLGLEPAAFMDELRKGVVCWVHERGTEEDMGKNRVTFRHRAQRAVLTLDDHGRLLDVA